MSMSKRCLVNFYSSLHMFLVTSFTHQAYWSCLSVYCKMPYGDAADDVVLRRLAQAAIGENRDVELLRSPPR